MVEKEALHSAESSAFAASRAFLLLMPTRALPAVSFIRGGQLRIEGQKLFCLGGGHRYTDGAGIAVRG